MPRDAGPDSGTDAGPPPAHLGDACASASDADCPDEAPVCLDLDGFAGGYCTQFCVEGAGDECPAGSLCTAIGFMNAACLIECDPSLEKPCRQGYGCGEGAPAGPVCAPGCDVDADCPDGSLCNGDDGLLAEGRCYDPAAQVADPCTEPEQCDADAWCVRERDRGWPGGACTFFGCNETDDTGCPGDAHCIFHFYRDPICADGCASDADCRAGYSCLPDAMFTDRLWCQPRCTDDGQCLEPGFRCVDGSCV